MPQLLLHGQAPAWQAGILRFSFYVLRSALLGRHSRPVDSEEAKAAAPCAMRSALEGSGYLCFTGLFLVNKIEQHKPEDKKYDEGDDRKPGCSCNLANNCEDKRTPDS